jgi:hypothetical protein
VHETHSTLKFLDLVSHPGENVSFSLYSFSSRKKGKERLKGKWKGKCMKLLLSRLSLKWRAAFSAVLFLFRVFYFRWKLDNETRWVSRVCRLYTPILPFSREREVVWGSRGCVEPSAQICAARVAAA